MAKSIFCATLSSVWSIFKAVINLPDSRTSDHTEGQALEPRSDLRSQESKLFKQKPSFSGLAPEIRLRVYHLLFPPSRTLSFSSTGFRLLPTADASDKLDEVYHNDYPITLHINQESRYETLKFYMLVVRDVTQFQNQDLHSLYLKNPMPPKIRQQQLESIQLHGPTRNITTWWCFNPAIDIFRLHDYTACECLITTLSLHPGYVENIKHAKSVDIWGGNLKLAKQQFCRTADFSYFLERDNVNNHMRLIQLLHLRRLETFTFSVEYPYLADSDSENNDMGNFCPKTLWLVGATFYIFFATLAKLDPTRTIPKIILNTPTTTMTFVIDSDTRAQKLLPSYIYSDLSKRVEMESFVVRLWQEFERRKQSTTILKYEAITWKDAGMGVVDKLEWDSPYVRTGRCMTTETQKRTGVRKRKAFCDCW